MRYLNKLLTTFETFLDDSKWQPQLSMREKNPG